MEEAGEEVREEHMEEESKLEVEEKMEEGPSPPPETLARQSLVGVAQGEGVELWGVTRYRALLTEHAAATLATTLVAFLNRGDGGTVLIGVKRDGTLKGLGLSREQEEEVRAVVARTQQGLTLRVV